VTASGLYFDENQSFSVTGDNIDFTGGTAIIPAEDPAVFGFQDFDGIFFPGVAQPDVSGFGGAGDFHDSPPSLRQSAK
jgi:hypothetical protein